MTKKKTFSKWTWREYLLQLSVVIAGIVVTFVGSGQIERWRQAHEVKVTMQLVYDELKTNRTELERICKKLRYDRRGMLMFQDYGMDVDKIPTDSLEKYMFIIGSIKDLLLQTDALEVLKTSGVIPSIGDKQLLMETIGCYRTLDGFNVTLKFYNQRKIDAMNHLFANSKMLRFSSDNPREGWGYMMSDPMCSAFIGTAAYNFGEDETFFDDLLLSVDKTTDVLNDKFDFE